nr:hypothetical protein [Tanacetum cinerariifolium]
DKDHGFVWGSGVGLMGSGVVAGKMAEKGGKQGSMFGRETLCLAHCFEKLARQGWRNGPPGLNKERSRAKSVEEGNKHCTECNKDGHTREGRFKLIGYPEWWPGKKGEKNKGKAACIKTETGPILGLTYEDYQLFLKHFSRRGNSEGTKPVANMAHKEDEEGEWIFDSGCTEYFTYLFDILVNKKATHFEAPVVILNGDSILVKGKGDHILSGGTKVNGVLYVPDFKCNLLSVSRLSRDLQCCISFFFVLCKDYKGRTCLVRVDVKGN